MVLVNTRGHTRWHVAGDWKSNVLPKEKSVDQKLEHRTIVIYPGLLVVVGVPTDPRLDGGCSCACRLKSKAINASAGPTTVKIKPSVFVEHKPLVLHFLRNQSSLDAFKLLGRVGLLEAQRRTNFWQRQSLP